MHDGYDSDEDESVSGYHKFLKEKATESYNELQTSLTSSPSVSPAQRRRRQARRARTPSPSFGKGHPTDHSDYTYGAAVDRLRNLLYKHDPPQSRPKIVQFSHPTRTRSQSFHSTSRENIHHHHHTSAATDSSIYKNVSNIHSSFPVHVGQRGELPASEEALPLLQNQSVLLQQLEADNKFYRDETAALKEKLKELIEENKLLHEALKKSVVQEILNDDVVGAHIPGDVVTEFNIGSSSRVQHTSRTDHLSRQDLTKWRTELERIKGLHDAKTSRLETQLTAARDETTKLENEVDRLKSQVRVKDALHSGGQGLTSGLCVSCGQNEAVLAASSFSQKQTIDKLMMERDDLVTQLASSRGEKLQMALREDQLYLKLKQSTEMVEQSQMEMTQALVQKEQLNEELSNIRLRLESHTTELQQQMQEERKRLREENKAEKDELHKKLQDISETLATTQLQLDKVSRDKVDLLTELSSARDQVTTFDTDYYKATDSMKMTITSASVERNAALRELKRAKQEIDNMARDHDQEKQRLRMELTDVRRRLERAEKDLVEAKEETIHLTSNNQTLEREAHLAKLSKESIERNRSDDLKALTRRAEQREEELSHFIENLENKHANAATEMDSMFSVQGNLVQRLREECSQLTKKLEEVTKKYKGDNKSLKSENSIMKEQLRKTKQRAVELEDQTVQQGSLQEKMRARLKQMDHHSQAATQQILELLSKESCLLKDRQLLAREIEFLRHQVLTANESDFDKLYSSRRIQVDDILNTCHKEKLTTEDFGVGDLNENVEDVLQSHAGDGET